MELFSPLNLPQPMNRSPRTETTSERRNPVESRGDGAENLSFQGILEDRREALAKPGSKQTEDHNVQVKQEARLTSGADAETTSGGQASTAAATGSTKQEATTQPVVATGHVSGATHPIMIEQMVKSMLGLTTAPEPLVAATISSETGAAQDLAGNSTSQKQVDQGQPGPMTVKLSGEDLSIAGKNPAAKTTNLEGNPAGQKTAQNYTASDAAISKELPGKIPVAMNTQDNVSGDIPKAKQLSPQVQGAAQSQENLGEPGKINLNVLGKMNSPQETVIQTQHVSPEQVKQLSPQQSDGAKVDADMEHSPAATEQVSPDETVAAQVPTTGATDQQTPQESQTQEAPLAAMKPAVASGQGVRGSATSNTATELASQAQKIRSQVVRELSTQMDGRIGQEKITLTLNPEKLGQVEIQFLAKDNNLSVVITASNGEAEQAIREGIKELSDGIADKSGRWNQVDIKVDQRGQDQDKNDSKQDPKRDSHKKDEHPKQQQNHQNKNHSQTGTPDWASLVSEG